jgi:hypothetical protein
MNSNSDSSINWLKIIFHKQFQSYLNTGILKELSLVSKIVRVKLSPKLFYAIKVENNSQYVGRKRIENYNIRSLTVLNNFLCSDENESNKELYAENVLTDIKSELTRIKKFVFSLCLLKSNNFGYYLVPIFESYINLKILKLYYCTIPYSLLVNLGVSFPNLKTVELCDLLLVKLPTDTTDTHGLNFPSNLMYLKFGEGKIIEQADLSNPYKMLVKSFSHEPYTIFKLPKISIPSLKKLIFIYFSGMDFDLKEFLNLNTSLESLKIRSINLDSVYNFNSIRSLEVDGVYTTGNEPTLPTQYSIKELTAKISYENEFEKVKKLCNLCPNLEKLKIIMPRARYEDSPQQQFDNFLTPVLSKLEKLKTLIINIDITESDILDISKFYYIENIVFEIYNPYLNFKFNNCVYLKSIEIKCKLFEFDNKKFMDEFNAMCSAYDNWVFKLIMGKIEGYKNY